MTRESKIGLAVATAFLCLLGVVIASKLRRPDSSTAPTAEVRPGDSGKHDPGRSAPEGRAATEKQDGPPGSKPPAPTGVQPDAVIPVAGSDLQTGVPAPLGGFPAPGVGITTNVGESGQPASPLPAAMKNGENGQPGTVLIPTPATPGVFGKEATPTTPIPGMPAIPSVAGVNPPEPAFPASPMPGGGPLPLVPEPLAPSGPVVVEPKKLPGDMTPTLPADPLQLSPGPKGQSGPTASGGKQQAIPVPPPIAAPNQPSSDPIVPPIPGTPNPLAEKADPLLPSVPKAEVKAPVPGAIPREPAGPEVKIGPSPLTPGAAVAPVVKAPSIGTIGTSGGDGPITPPLTPMFPGSASDVTNKTLPPVKNYAEERHFVGPNEDSFEKLSERFYKSPKYARALLEYNRQHVLAKANILQDPPLLQPNQAIYYPPPNILEIQYGQYITGSPAAVRPPGGSAVGLTPTPMVGLSTPTPLPAPGPGSLPVPSVPVPSVPVPSVPVPSVPVPSVPGSGAPGPGAPGPNPPTADPTTSYRLQQAQYIFDIARQTLGDGQLWTEILRLNPSLHTEQPIPAGTELRLPASARPR
jgi:hypothetical protein